jgi:hypothetical protein
MYKNNLTLVDNLKKLYNIRPVNVFTKRGIRFARQKILKKTGKRV